MSDLKLEIPNQELNILRLIDRNNRAIVVGPIVVNETINGNCKRIASDFPIPVFEDTKRVYDIGGPGNLVKNIKALGLGVDLITMIGEDDHYVINTMDKEFIDTSGAIKCPGYSVAKKIRYISDGYVCFRVNEGNEDFLISDKTERAIIDMFQEKIDSVVYRVVILSDYRFGMLSERVTSAIISISNSKGIPVIVDPPKFGNYDKFKGCTYFKPNLEEAKYFLRKKIDTDQEIRSACIEICRKLQTRFTIITLAEKGIAFFDEDQTDGTFGVVPVPSGINVEDVNGAGDTALAAITFGVASSLDLQTTCVLANACAANVIQKPGTVSVDLLELNRDKEIAITSKEEVENLKQLLGGRGSTAVLIGSFDPLISSHHKVIKKSITLAKNVIAAVDQDHEHRTDNLDDEVPFVVEMLKSNKYIDFVIVLGSNLEKEWVVDCLHPDYFVDINLSGANIVPYCKSQNID